MPRNKIQKSIREYMWKMKGSHRSPIHLPSKKWMMSGCKHPRTHSMDMDKVVTTPNNVKDDQAMLADIDRFLLENFKSLFLEDIQQTTHHSSTRFLQDSHHSSLFTDTTTDAGSSSTASTETDHHQTTVVPDNCLVLLANSASPAEDFRRSMQGMVEARIRNHVNVDWDFMEELFHCHMNLNHKNVHKFILSAFVDVVSAMRRQPENQDHPKEIPQAEPKPRSVRTVKIGRELHKNTKEITLEFESL
ncbi:hypothetical protein Fmac_012536 [Flemingia macrophylla]|uniref:Transcription repressor n=1 Tax=Flemingia macrophylla TaxID=520843 RepID=A0ABD1MSQ4_9FABA